MHGIMGTTAVCFSSEDHELMRIALEKAVQALNDGDFPVGAALAIDGVCVDSECNSNTSDWTWTSHAEHKLILRHSDHLRRDVQSEGARVELFTTFEPCLMCLGIAVFSRIRRVVYAVPDQNAGVASLDPSWLRDWYAPRWPVIQEGLLREKSEALIRLYKPIHPRTDD